MKQFKNNFCSKFFLFTYSWLNWSLHTCRFIINCASLHWLFLNCLKMVWICLLHLISYFQVGLWVSILKLFLIGENFEFFHLLYFEFNFIFTAGFITDFRAIEHLNWLQVKVNVITLCTTPYLTKIYWWDILEGRTIKGSIFRTLV